MKKLLQCFGLAAPLILSSVPSFSEEQQAANLYHADTSKYSCNNEDGSESAYSHISLEPRADLYDDKFSIQDTLSILDKNGSTQFELVYPMSENVGIDAARSFCADGIVPDVRDLIDSETTVSALQETKGIEFSCRSDDRSRLARVYQNNKDGENIYFLQPSEDISSYGFLENQLSFDFSKATEAVQEFCQTGAVPDFEDLTM